MHNGIAIANALIAWPDGKENWSGGRTLAQQWASTWHGRLRLLAFFKARNRKRVAASAVALAAKATYLKSPPNSSRVIPTEYQIQPSPRRVDHTIQTRSHRGARQRLSRRMTRWSRASMNCQTILLAVTAIPPTPVASDAPVPTAPLPWIQGLSYHPSGGRSQGQ